jgi:hypothetical protein
MCVTVFAFFTYLLTYSKTPFPSFIGLHGWKAKRPIVRDSGRKLVYGACISRCGAIRYMNLIKMEGLFVDAHPSWHHVTSETASRL